MGESTPRSPAPEIVAVDQRGKTIRLSGYRSKIVLLTFWATYCRPCLIEARWFADFQEQLHGDVVVLGADVDDDGWRALDSFLGERRFPYSVFVTTERTQREYGGIKLVPSTFLIDAHGQIVFRHMGLVSKATYAAEIEQLLREERRRWPL